MCKSVLQDTQQVLNAIRIEIERVYDETKRAAIQLMLAMRNCVLASLKENGQNQFSTKKNSFPT